MDDVDDRGVSAANTTALWLDRLGPIVRRPALDGDIDADVAIVGGGFSGLWTAYYLSRLDPTLRVVVLEKHFCGFGASGRNGGWAVGELAGSRARYAARSSPDAADRLAHAVQDSVDEIGRVAATEDIDCGYVKGGWIRLARTAPQAQRQRDEVAHERSLGVGDDVIRLLEPDEARQHLQGSDVRGGIFFGPCASLDPAQLVRGLAAAAEHAGVTIHEDTTVTAVGNRRVETTSGTVRAGVVVRGTEAYTRDLGGERRALLPVYSFMVATEQLPPEVFENIGLSGRPTFSDDRTMVIYGQRTDDDRLAFGGAGLPYLFGSKISADVETHLPTHLRIRQVLADLVPAVADAQITHRWGGVLGIPRDWVPGLSYDESTGDAVLGGYVGEGVAAANLAGRTMADLIVGNDTERSTLPWVGVKPRHWEPEPLRWIGVRSSRRIFTLADQWEQRRDRESKLASRLGKLLRGA